MIMNSWSIAASHGLQSMKTDNSPCEAALRHCSAAVPPPLRRRCSQDGVSAGRSGGSFPGRATRRRLDRRTRSARSRPAGRLDRQRHPDGEVDRVRGDVTGPEHDHRAFEGRTVPERVRISGTIGDEVIVLAGDPGVGRKRHVLECSWRGCAPEKSLRRPLTRRLDARPWPHRASPLTCRTSSPSVRI